MWSEVGNSGTRPGAQTDATQHIPEVVGMMSNVEKKEMDRSPLEVTFTSPNEPLQNKGPLQPSNGKKSGKRDKYQALELGHTTIGNITRQERQLKGESVAPEDEGVGTALVALALSLFGPLFALGMAYWHYVHSAMAPATLSLAILLLTLGTLQLSFFFAKMSPKTKVWKWNPVACLLCAIPGLTSPTLSFCNLIFSIGESHSRSYERPWGNTKFLFLMEALCLAVPQGVLHLVLMAEDNLYLSSHRGLVSVVGTGILSFAATFARFRYDTQTKCDRFGSGPEKYIRFGVIWANKVLWMITFTMVVISLRLSFPSHETVSTLGAICLLLALHELPILLLVSPVLKGAATTFLGLLMLIPQFVALSALLLLVNVNLSVYDFTNGALLLGAFFWTEVIILTGWLYDRCTEREVDFIPIYPHFFGDLFSSLRD